MAAVTGFIAITSFYNLLNGFSMNCLLFTNVQLRDIKPEESKYEGMLSNGTNVTIDSITTVWNKDLLCQYCLLVWTLSFVGGIILSAFFILNPKGGRGYAHSM